MIGSSTAQAFDAPRPGYQTEPTFLFRKPITIAYAAMPPVCRTGWKFPTSSNRRRLLNRSVRCHGFGRFAAHNPCPSSARNHATGNIEVLACRFARWCRVYPLGTGSAKRRILHHATGTMIGGRTMRRKFGLSRHGAGRHRRAVARPHTLGRCPPCHGVPAEAPSGSANSDKYIQMSFPHQTAPKGHGSGVVTVSSARH